jgi:hypothetical protein
MVHIVASIFIVSSRSLRTKTPGNSAKMMLVSRKAATKGIGATVKAQVTIAYARNEAPPMPMIKRNHLSSQQTSHQMGNAPLSAAKQKMGVIGHQYP